MRLLVVFLLSAIAVLAGFFVWGNSLSDWLTVGRIQSWGPWAGATCVALLVADLLIPVPSTVLMSALGYIHGWFVGGCLAAVGSMASGLLGYGLARCLGPGMAIRLLGKRDYERGQALKGTVGPWLVALTRSAPILSEVVACFAGLLRMPFPSFLLALASGVIPVAFVFAAFGSLGKDQPGVAIAVSLAVPPILWWAAARCLSARGKRDRP